MRQLFSVLTALFFFTTLMAQSGFESGYFITENGSKVTCFIRNKDWGNNPRQFKYKSNADEEAILIGSIASVREFGIGNTQKYRKFIVAIDRTTEDIDKLGFEKEPINVSDTIFLKVLVEGKASLYSFESGELRRFFMQIGDEPIQQLVYKSYLTENRLVARNESYKQQLAAALQCGNTLYPENLKYEKRELSRAFTHYNQCSGGTNSDFSSISGKTSVHLTIRPGIKFASFKISRPPAPPVDPNSLNIGFKDQSGFRFGFETELVLPVNKNNLSFIFEPTYQNYRSTSTNPAHPASIRYSSLELPLGLRYTFNPKAKGSFFLNFLYSQDISFDSRIKFENIGYSDLELKPGGAFSFGAGAKIRNRYHVELRLTNGRDLIKTSAIWSSNYSFAGLIVGYTIR